MRNQDDVRRSAAPRARVLGPTDGEITGAAGVLHDRFLVRGEDAGGGFALVEHLIPPGVLAAPLHRHTREDEYSYVLAGRVGAVFEGTEVFASAGDLVFKPRGEWHTFWNAGDVPLRILELIAPGGFEQAFRELAALGDALTPDGLAEIATRYGVDVDFEATGPLMERYGLTMA
jgi:mannose-6-phosphate isomerase-like protein (cupin superfamily)